MTAILKTVGIVLAVLVVDKVTGVSSTVARMVSKDAPK